MHGITVYFLLGFEPALRWLIAALLQPGYIFLYLITCERACCLRFCSTCTVNQKLFWLHATVATA